MDGVHDLGGKQGFGPVVREADEPPFHAPWEGRVHGMDMTARLGPGFRSAIERMDPVEYLTTSYYEHWLHSMEARGVAHGHFTDAELAAWRTRLAAGERLPVRRAPGAAEAARAELRPGPVARYEAAQARFAAGDRVRVIRLLPAGHTRCPGYLRGAPGAVESAHPPLPLLDVSECELEPSVVEPWYTVAFAASDLWPEAAGHTVLVDLWESHLEEPA